MNRRPARGFTLIEVLAAMVIISLGMLAVIEAVTQTLNNANYLREKTVASWVALNQIATTRLASTAPTAGNTEGDVDMAGTTWHWRMVVSATDISSMLRMDVNVAPKDAGDKASIASATGFYATTISITGARMEWDPQPNAGRNRGGNTGAPGNNDQNSGSSSSRSSFSASSSSGST